MIFLAVVFFAALAWHLWPLFACRIKLKKVRLKITLENGQTSEQVLYLQDNDPLWELVEQVRGKKNERPS